MFNPYQIDDAKIQLIVNILKYFTEEFGLFAECLNCKF